MVRSASTVTELCPEISWTNMDQPSPPYLLLKDPTSQPRPSRPVAQPAFPKTGGPSSETDPLTALQAPDGRAAQRTGDLLEVVKWSLQLKLRDTSMCWLGMLVLSGGFKRFYEGLIYLYSGNKSSWVQDMSMGLMGI